MKHYVIFNGIDPKTKQKVENIILHLPWSEVEPYIKGVSGAKFKGFKSEQAALTAISETSENKEQIKIEGLACYVDGSYNGTIKNYGYGLVCFRNGQLVHYDAGKGKNKEAVAMQQIAGELSGAMNAMLYAKKEKEKRVTIFHDYMGVAKHATGEWKRTSDFSKLYYAWMQRFFQENPSIQVEFLHVAAHTGDLGNELADGLAKLSVGIEPNKVFFRKATEVNMNIDSLYLNI